MKALCVPPLLGEDPAVRTLFTFLPRSRGTWGLLSQRFHFAMPRADTPEYFGQISDLEAQATRLAQAGQVRSGQVRSGCQARSDESYGDRTASDCLVGQAGSSGWLPRSLPPSSQCDMRLTLTLQPHSPWLGVLGGRPGPGTTRDNGCTYTQPALPSGQRTALSGPCGTMHAACIRQSISMRPTSQVDQPAACTESLVLVRLVRLAGLTGPLPMLVLPQ